MNTDKHRVLVIGAGSIGERHVRCFTATERAAVAIAEVNAELGRSVAGRYGVRETFTDLREAVKHGFSAAVIATPAPLHVPMAAQLAEAGTHLLIEKPLAVTLDGVADLEQAVAKRHLTAAVAYVYRAHPALSAMQQAIRAGRFGRPLQVVATCGQHFPTYRPAYQDTYYARHASGGGAVQDALTHVINAGEWLVGPVTKVVADAERLALHGVDVEDTAHVIARHGAVMGSYTLNQHQAPNEVTITVIADRGTARFEFHRGRWSWMTQPSDSWQTQEQPETLERDTLFARQTNAFLDAVEDKAGPLCTLAEGVQTLKVNVAILQSAARSMWQEVTPHVAHF